MCSIPLIYNSIGVEISGRLVIIVIDIYLIIIESVDVAYGTCKNT